MRRAAFFLLTLSLLAFGCEVGALCSVAQATDSSCCCPLMEAMNQDGMDGMNMGRGGTPPCMEETGDMPRPADSEATFDGAAQAWILAPPVSSLQPRCASRALGLPGDLDLAAGHGPALYLLGCSFLN